MSIAGITENSRMVGHGRQLHCSAEEMLAFIAMIQYLTFNSHLGNGRTKEVKEKQHQLFKSGDNFRPCIEEYVYYARARDGELLGWMFLYVIQDESFTYEKALQVYWSEVAKAAKERRHVQDAKRPKHVGCNTDLILAKMPTKHAFLNNALFPYLGDGLDQQQRDNAVGFPLDDNKNPARLPATCTVEYAIGLIKRAHPVSWEHSLAAFRTEVVDLGDQDDDLFAEVPEAQGGAGKRVRFPGGAYCVPVDFRDPSNLLNMNLVTPPDDADINNPDFRRKQRRGVITEAPAREPGHAMREGRIWLEKETRGKTLAQRYEFLRTTKYTEFFQTVLADDDKNPGGLRHNTCFDAYMQEGLVTCTYIPPDLDPTLTAFGNNMARFSYKIELFADIAYVSSHVMLLVFASMNIGDIESTDMRVHVVFTGDPAVSKSHIIVTFARLCPPNSTHEVASQSKKAMTTDSNQNGLILTMDELGEHITGEGDGTGSSTLKTMLVTGQIRTETCLWEDGKRVLVETVTERKCNAFGATNKDMSDVHFSVTSRFLVVVVTYVRRPGFNAISETMKTRSSATRTANFDRFAREEIIIKCIAIRYWTAVRLGALPRPNFGVVPDVAADLFGILATEHGNHVAIRDEQRVLDLTLGLCMYHAIREVFFSGRVVAMGATYSDAMLPDLVPYLVATREQLYYAVTLAHQIVVDARTCIVLRALKYIAENGETPVHNSFNGGSGNSFNQTSAEKQQAAQARSHRAELRGHLSGSDYCIEINKTSSIYETQGMVAAEVYRAIERMRPKPLPMSEIKLVLGRLEDTKRPGGAPGETIAKTMSQAERDEFGVAYTVSRAYVDSYTSSGHSSLVAAIRKTMDRKFKIPRILTGLPLVTPQEGYGDHVFPWLFEVIDVRETDRTAVVKVDVAGAKRFGEDALLGRSTAIDPPTKKRKDCIEDVDDLAQENWLKLTQSAFRALHVTNPASMVEAGERYPTRFMDAHMQENGWMPIADQLVAQPPQPHPLFANLPPHQPHQPHLGNQMNIPLAFFQQQQQQQQPMAHNMYNSSDEEYEEQGPY